MNDIERGNHETEMEDLSDNVNEIQESGETLACLSEKLDTVQTDVKSLSHRMTCLEAEANIFGNEYEECECCASKDDEISDLEFRISELEDEKQEEDEEMRTHPKYTREQLIALWEQRSDSGAGPCWCNHRTGEYDPHEQHCFELRVMFRFHPCWQLGMFVPGDPLKQGA